MRSSMIALAGLALAACAPSRDLPLPNARTYLIFELEEDDTPRDVHVYDAATRQLPYYGGRLRVLAYDEDLAALMLVIDDDRTFDLLPKTAPIDDAWPLVPPDRWVDVPAGSGAPVEGQGSLDTWLATFTVARPPCAPRPMARNVDGIAGEGGINFLFRWGPDRLFLANNAHMTAVPGGIYFLPIGETQVEPIASLSHTATAPRSGYQAYIDGNEARVAVADEVRNDWDLYRIDLEGKILERIATETPGRQLFKSMTLQGDDIIVRSERYSPRGAPSIDVIERFEPNTKTWAPIYSSTIADARDCDGAEGQKIFDFDHGLIGLVSGSIYPFQLTEGRLDIDTSAALIPGAKFCRTAYVRLSDGTEVIAFGRPMVVGVEPSGLLWRRAGEPHFEPADDQARVSGDVLEVFGNRIIGSGNSRTIAIYEHTPERPEIRPRFCHELGVGIRTTIVLPLDDHTIVLGGADGGRVVYLDFPQ